MSLGSETEGIEGFYGLPFFPPKHTDSLHEGWTTWKNLESLEIGNTGDPTHFSCAFWPHRCLGVESLLRGHARKQSASKHFHDWLCQPTHLHHLYLVPRNSKLIVNLWVTWTFKWGVSQQRNRWGALSQALSRHPCSLQKKGYAWKSMPAKDGLVKTLMPFNKLD